MLNLYRATIALAAFAVLYGSTKTRIDGIFPDAYSAIDMLGDAVLALGVLAVVFVIAAVKDAVKAIVKP